jgi:hypothetical protein
VHGYVYVYDSLVSVTDVSEEVGVYVKESVSVYEGVYE